MNNAGDVTGSQARWDFPPESHRKNKEKSPQKTNIQSGKTHRMAAAVEKGGLPKPDTGQTKWISAKRPAPSSTSSQSQITLSLPHKGIKGYQQQSFSPEKKVLIYNLIAYVQLHLGSMQVEGFTRTGGEKRTVDALVINHEKFQSDLEGPWDKNFSLTVAEAIVKAFENSCPFSETGYHLFLKAGKQTSFKLLAQALNTLPREDKEIMLKLGQFIYEAAEAQKHLPVDKRMSLQSIAMTFGGHFSAGTDPKFIMANINNINAALALLAQHHSTLSRQK